MRTPLAYSLLSLISAATWACADDVGDREVGNSSDGISAGTTSTTAGAAGVAGAAGGSATAGAGSSTVAGAGPVTAGGAAGAPDTDTTPTKAGAAGSSGDAAGSGGSATDADAGASGAAGTSPMGAGGMSTVPDDNTPAVVCTDTPPDDRETCATWAEWGECGAEWIAGFCEVTCGVCEEGSSTNGDDPDPATDPEPEPGLSDDNPYSPINGGQQGNSTRYWDCCKQSCGWNANASNPVSSCDYGGNNIGTNDQNRNVCGDGGNATTCHGMAPWAYSTQVAYGYAAANGATCGTCWQLQFTGTANNGQVDEGASRISGKTMVVMATNIGDLNGALHFDLLIPGGGLGLNNGCSTSLGIPEGELGANRGGFLTECAGSGDLNAKKECVRNKCESVFGSRGLGDLEAGCLWFVDWFEAADNPDFLVQQVDCPQDLRKFN